MNGLRTCILWIVVVVSTASTVNEQRLSNLVAIVGRHFTYQLPEDPNSKSPKYMVSF